MFRGDYNFFDYKYNIAGYEGQDYGGFAQYLYLVISCLLIISILIFIRNIKKDKVLMIIRIISIFLIIFYIVKTTWETIYDIRLSGSFNYGLLPFDSCSIIMLAGIITGFTKGKIEKYSSSWIVTGGIVGGIAAMLYLNAFKYYPFLSFGAFYSMLWHLLMVFLGLLLIVTNYVNMNYKTVIKGFIFHLFISIFVIIIDFIFDFDFMMYKNLGGIPIFEDIASKFNMLNLSVLNPFMMLLLYFIAFNIIYLVYLIIKKVYISIKN